jgi:MORN repeat
VCPNGNFYDGQFWNGNKHALASCSMLDVYTGDWHDDMKHGDGLMDCRNADVYNGNWHTVRT